MYEVLLERFQNGLFSEVISLALSNNITPDNDPNSSHVLAASYFSLGQISESIELLSELESSLMNDVNYLSLYGAALRRSGDLDASKKLFLQALEASPNNPVLQNNYANLLIDLKNFTEASTLLSGVISKNPDYTDALDNLKRIRSLQSLDKSSSGLIQPAAGLSSSVVDFISKDSLLDPLLLAFTSEEVNLHGRVKPLSGLKEVIQNPDIRSLGLEKLQLAVKSAAEGNFSYALKLCSQAYVQLGCEPSVYDCVSEAYFRANRFLESELTILHALAMSGPSVKSYINLVSLTSMRRDFSLAEHYLDKLIFLDKSHASIPQLRQQLKKLKKDISVRPYMFEDHPASTPLSKQAN